MSKMFDYQQQKSYFLPLGKPENQMNQERKAPLKEKNAILLINQISECNAVNSEYLNGT